MASRDPTPVPEPSTDATSEKILDAALQVLTDFGFKKATVELVAKTAGVAHTTVYRRWSTRDELLRAAVIREVHAVFDAALRTIDDEATFDDKVLTAFIEVVWSVHTHPLMARELRIEPETALPLLTTAAAPVLPGALDFVAERLRIVAAASGVQLDDPESLADILLRLAHSLVLVPNPGRPLRRKADVDAYARRYLQPLTQSAVVTGVRP
ncbi:TetR/AcrR family transcriptional regulator [Mycolicibacterium stellerae]|uniref:TetR/AcrR family transcriptional regulator n=1 Tax=Mycolicibacterium stellerae TaxID=2358193 RepID=UPI000F0AFC60|nr:TetR/AcrR family transcriptional regulator [Mycolicibacterium stellerae]